MTARPGTPTSIIADHWSPEAVKARAQHDLRVRAQERREQAEYAFRQAEQWDALGKDALAQRWLDSAEKNERIANTLSKGLQ